MIGKIVDTTTKTFLDAFGVLAVSAVIVVGAITLLMHILGVAGFIQDAGTVFTGGPVVTVIGTGIVLLMGSVMLRDRGLTNDILALALFALSLYIAATFSVLLALVPVAILSTIGGSKPSA